jgi:hypothetical protein
VTRELSEQTVVKVEELQCKLKRRRYLKLQNSKVFSLLPPNGFLRHKVPGVD